MGFAGVGKETSKYQIVPTGFFACNLMHVGRDVVLPIAYNHSAKQKYVMGFHLAEQNTTIWINYCHMYITI